MDPPFVPGAYVTVFSDNFESYVSGHTPLDKNYAGGNAAPNGSGNPWFGPFPPNAYVVGAESGVTPHSGTNALTGDGIPYDGDENWYNLAYRLRGGQVFQGNCMLDWWFYDPSGSGDTTFADYVALAYYNTAPGNTDYPGAGSLNSSTQVQRLSLGAAINQSDNPGPGSLFDSSLYQARVVGGVYDYAYGWRNTTTARGIGWHHGRIILGSPLPDGTAPVYYYIDDMVTPTTVGNSATTWGFNVIEINLQTSATTGWMDDVSFALAVPPNLTVNKAGSSATLTWPGSGWTLQSASTVNGAWTDVSGAGSGYTYDTTTSSQQYFRLRN
ncbi:MAG TPA: hypothetical protein VMU04_17060 [Candidatus Acidoferrum sp.]|nr:hypothetical protein [Candidatus Acidoferrum sp.]